MFLNQRQQFEQHCVYPKCTRLVWGPPRWLRRLRIRLPMQETQVRSLGREDSLDAEMATHSSILAGRIPWTEETGGAAVHVVARIGHD